MPCAGSALTVAATAAGSKDDPDMLVAELQTSVDNTDIQDIGHGEEFVYVYRWPARGCFLAHFCRNGSRD
jgi:hypothetical protein